MLYYSKWKWLNNENYTASEKKDVDNLLKLLNLMVKIIELDFVLTKDYVPIWTHNRSINLIPIKKINSTSKLLSKYLTLYDIIKLNDFKKTLLLDFKYIDRIDREKMKHMLDRLQEYNNLKKGLIINYFTSHNVNKKNISGLEGIDKEQTE